MLHAIGGDGDPIVLASFVNRVSWRSEIGVVERSERNRNQALELASDVVLNVSSTLRAEVEGRRIAAVPAHYVNLGFPVDRNLLGRPPRLNGERTAASFLAIEAMAD